MEELLPALRQYRHNNSNEFVAGYEKEETEKIFRHLRMEIERLEIQLLSDVTPEKRKQAEAENSLLRGALENLASRLKETNQFGPLNAVNHILFTLPERPTKLRELVDGCQKTIPKAPTFGQEKEWQTHEDFRKSVEAMADQLCFVDIYEENIDDLVVVLHRMGYVTLGE